MSYMIIMGLVITSCGFIIPAVIGFVRKRRIDALLSVGLAATSVWNHSRSSKLAKTVDVTYAHGVATYYVMISSMKLLEKVALADIYTLFGIMAISQIYYKKSRQCRFWHMGLHAIAIMSWTIRMLTH